MSQEKSPVVADNKHNKPSLIMWVDFSPLCKTGCITIEQKYIHKKNTSSIFSCDHTAGMPPGIKSTLTFNTALFCDAHFWPV